MIQIKQDRITERFTSEYQLEERMKSLRARFPLLRMTTIYHSSTDIELRYIRLLTHNATKIQQGA